MSKTPYDKIAELSTRYAQQFYKDQSTCNSFAYDFGKRFISYLGCEPDVVSHSTPRICGAELVKCHGKPFLNAVPKCVHNEKDGYWYFAMSIEYRIESDRQYYCEEMYQIGVRVVGDSICVRIGSVSTENFELSNDDHVNQIFEQFCVDVIDDYEGFLSRNSFQARIGFGVQPGSTKDDE